MDLQKKIRKAAYYILKKSGFDQIRIAIIFGSSLNPTKKIAGKIIPFNHIPYFPVYRTPLQDNKIICAEIANKNVICFLGRIHYYDGYSAEEVVFPIRVLKELGVNLLIITNAAGGINPKFKPGDLMLIKDQINMTGLNPLIGTNIDAQGERFVDMSQAFSSRLNKLAKRISLLHLENPLREGTYLGVTGPNYETPAEINFFRKIGADAVGMSTVLETIIAKHCRIETLGLSCITNVASYLNNKITIRHTRVVENARNIEPRLLLLIFRILEKL